eukprot:Hpha_TRINITY_DN5726_c0_g1::TRINITY_DN5726_c0_g1_i1::g.147669::m.147669
MGGGMEEPAVAAMAVRRVAEALIEGLAVASKGREEVARMALRLRPSAEQTCAAIQAPPVIQASPAAARVAVYRTRRQDSRPHDQDEDPGIDLDISEVGDDQAAKAARADSLELDSLPPPGDETDDDRGRVAKAEAACAEAVAQRDQAMGQWEELLQQLLTAEAERDEERRLREEVETQLRVVQSRLRVHEQKTASRQRSEAQLERLEGKVRELRVVVIWWCCR